MLIGYIRVSTNDQNTALQRNALECAGCELFFEDRISGKTRERPGLKRALKRLRPGDTLLVWKLDRLGRSMQHLVLLTEELRQRGVNFRSITDNIDTSTPMGRFFFHIMARWRKWSGNSLLNVHARVLLLPVLRGVMAADLRN